MQWRSSIERGGQETPPLIDAPADESFTDQQATYLTGRFGQPVFIPPRDSQGIGATRSFDAVLGALAGATVVGIFTDVIDPLSLTGFLVVMHGLVVPVGVIAVSRRAADPPQKPQYLATADTWTDDS